MRQIQWDAGILNKLSTTIFAGKFWLAIMNSAIFYDFK